MENHPKKQARPAISSAEDGKDIIDARVERLEKTFPGLTARKAALDLMGLLRRQVPLDQALEMCPSFLALEGADRGFARHITATTLRNLGRIDAIVGEFLDRPLPKRNAAVMDILRLTAGQLLFLETPAHAAVSTATELAGLKRETAGFKGLVNAISRRISEKGPALLEKAPFRTDTPGWLWRSWERQFGPTVTRAIAEAHKRQAPVDLILKPGAPTADLLALDGAMALPGGSVRLPAGTPVPELPGFADGTWWVQDFAASLPVALAGPVDGLEVLDLCAAPGGKTLQLAAGGAKVTALDVSAKRLERVRENLSRTGLAADIVEADLLKWAPEEPVDLVLLDAPCSATGTIRRHPDIPWYRDEQAVGDLARLQAKMIDHALGFLKPGGRLLYCTCSIQRSEGEDQVKAALTRHEDVALEPLMAPFEGLPENLLKGGMLRTLPSFMADEGGMDGFFAAMLKKG